MKGQPILVVCWRGFPVKFWCWIGSKPVYSLENFRHASWFASGADAAEMAKAYELKDFTIETGMELATKEQNQRKD